MVQNLVAEAVHNVMTNKSGNEEFHDTPYHRNSRSGIEHDTDSHNGKITGRANRDHPSLRRGKLSTISAFMIYIHVLISTI